MCIAPCVFFGCIYWGPTLVLCWLTLGRLTRLTVCPSTSLDRITSAQQPSCFHCAPEHTHLFHLVPALPLYILDVHVYVYKTCPSPSRSSPTMSDTHFQP